MNIKALPTGVRFCDAVDCTRGWVHLPDGSIVPCQKCGSEAILFDEPEPWPLWLSAIVWVLILGVGAIALSVLATVQK